MQIRILDLDGSLGRQGNLLKEHQPPVLSRPEWGPLLRLGCSHGLFRRFELSLFGWLEGKNANGPALTLYGSGDFHHVSLALLRRQKDPFNLLVIDKHPDWMHGLPFMHCGTWLNHAARLPNCQRIFHVGGDLDFDNSFRWMAPWKLLRSGKITVFPAIRRYSAGGWTTIPHESLRPLPGKPLDSERMFNLLGPHRAELERFPLYISLDKDVMTADDAAVNWDSGHLRLPEVEKILHAFTKMSGGALAGMDIVGDWSPVHTKGWFRKFLHLTEHPTLHVDPDQAIQLNEETNLRLLEAMETSASEPALTRVA